MVQASDRRVAAALAHRVLSGAKQPFSRFREHRDSERTRRWYIDNELDGINKGQLKERLSNPNGGHAPVPAPAEP